MRPGDQLPVSDALSRLSSPKVNAVTGQLTMKQLKDEQEADPLLLYACKCLSSGKWGDARPADLEKSKLWNHKDRLFFGAKGELYIRSVDSASPGGLLVLPRGLVPSMLDAFHDKIAHPGTASTPENIQRLYWWPSVNKDVTDYVRSCNTCATTKPNLHP